MPSDRTQNRLSLTSRILLSGMLLNLIVLPFIGFTLNKAFEKQLNTALYDQLQAHVFSVLSVLEVLPQSPDGTTVQKTEEETPILMPDALIDNQFNLIDSGQYAFIVQAPKRISALNSSAESTETTLGQLIWQSASALSLDFESVLQNPAYAQTLSPGTGKTSTIEIDISSRQYIAYSYGVSVERPFDIAALEEMLQDQPSAVETTKQGSLLLNKKWANKKWLNQKRPTIELSVSILKDKEAYRQQLSAFTDTLWTWLIVLMLLLMVVQLIWLYWILAPLRLFSKELQSLERGESESLTIGFPKELNRVAVGVNSVVKAFDAQQQKYRNAIADLAHSLKTPLAIIQSQKDLSKESVEQSQTINKLINYQLNKTKVSTRSIWSSKTQVNNLIQTLVRTFSKLYHDKNLDIAFVANTPLIFNGEEEDLNEILGNLIDNACKAASCKVQINAEQQQNTLVITIEDDGLGMEQALRTTLFERGKRADTYAEGHGIGLAIVQDLLTTYKGELAVGRSPTLKGACFTLKFT